MNVQVITITPFDHIPHEPAPFFANGKPSWVAVLPQQKIKELSVTWEKPNKKFISDIKNVFVDGVQVYPKS